MPLPTPRRTALAAATLALIATPLATATTAHAQYPPTIPLEINDDDSIVEAGDEIAFIARSYDPGEPATIQLAPQTTTHHRAAQPPTTPQTITLGHATANSQGTVIDCVTIPPHTPEGTYLIKVIGHESGRTLTTPLTIQENAPGGTTGGNPTNPNTGGTTNPNNTPNNTQNNSSGNHNPSSNQHSDTTAQNSGQHTQNNQQTGQHTGQTTGQQPAQNNQSSHGGQQHAQNNQSSGQHTNQTAASHDQQHAHGPHQRSAATDQLAHTGNTTTWALTSTAAALTTTGAAALVITRRRRTHTR